MDLYLYHPKKDNLKEHRRRKSKCESGHPRSSVKPLWPGKYTETWGLRDGIRLDLPKYTQLPTLRIVILNLRV